MFTFRTHPSSATAVSYQDTPLEQEKEGASKRGETRRTSER
jgi:hypothetical protein